MTLRTSRKRLITFLVCAFVVLGAVLGVVGWATLGGYDGPPECAKHLKAMSGTSEAGRNEIIDCTYKVAQWCHEHHPDDTPACTKAISTDGDDRNVGKRSIAARHATVAPSAKSTLSPLQQAFEKDRKALYDWYESGLDPLDINIVKMELKPDGYVYITVDVPSSNHDHDAGLDAFNSYHQDDFQTTLKHMTELRDIKGIKTLYNDGKPIQAPDLSVNN
ncbi:hypothetical protein AB0D78_27065 [Streptomyces avermitilis]|uniref:hypothetical protein n=1 Tax=Streptomyces avermitilis TaxID=33903 RepID=UPI0033CBEB22